MAKESALDQINDDFDEQMTNKQKSESQTGDLLNQLMDLAKTDLEKAQALAKEKEDELKLAMAAMQSREADETDLRLMAELVNKDVEIRERLNREHLTAQLGQVQRAQEASPDFLQRQLFNTPLNPWLAPG